MTPRIQLSPRDRFALRLGTTVLLPALVVGFVLIPLRERQRVVSAAVESERGLLARELALVAQTEDLRRRKEDGQRALAEQASRLFLMAEGAEPGREPEAVLDFVGLAAAESNVSILESRVVGGDSLGAGLGVVTLELVAQSDLQGVLELLQRLERGPKLIGISSLRLEAVGGVEQADAPEVLQLRAQLLGYMPLD